MTVQALRRDMSQMEFAEWQGFYAFESKQLGKEV